MSTSDTDAKELAHLQALTIELLGFFNAFRFINRHASVLGVSTDTLTAFKEALDALYLLVQTNRSIALRKAHPLIKTPKVTDDTPTHSAVQLQALFEHFKAEHDALLAQFPDLLAQARELEQATKRV